MNFEAFRKRPDQNGEYSIVVRRIDGGSLEGRTTPPIYRKSLSEDSLASIEELKRDWLAEETARIERQRDLDFHLAPLSESKPVKDNKIKPDAAD